MVLLFLKDKEIKLGKYKVRNYLGGHKWLNDYAYELYITSIGIMIMVITICVLFFALGFLVTILQVGALIVCNGIMNISVQGQSPLDVCITVPLIQDKQFCGWEAMSVCENMNNMEVSFCLYEILFASAA